MLCNDGIERPNLMPPMSDLALTILGVVCICIGILIWLVVR